MAERTARPAIVAEAEAAVNEAHIEAVKTFLTANSIRPRDVAVIGFHGQTVLHRPERRLGKERMLEQFCDGFLIHRARLRDPAVAVERLAGPQPHKIVEQRVARSAVASNEIVAVDKGDGGDTADIEPTGGSSPSRRASARW